MTPEISIPAATKASQEKSRKREFSRKRLLLKASLVAGYLALALPGGQRALAQEQKPAKDARTLPVPIMRYVGVVDPELKSRFFDVSLDLENQVDQAGFNSDKVAEELTEGEFNDKDVTELCNAAGATQAYKHNFAISFLLRNPDHSLGYLPSNAEQANTLADTLVKYVDLLAGPAATEKPQGISRCSTLTQPMGHVTFIPGNELNLSTFVKDQDNAPANFVTTYSAVYPAIKNEAEKLGVDVEVDSLPLTTGHHPLEFYKKVGQVMKMRSIKFTQLGDAVAYNPFAPASDISPAKKNRGGNYVGVADYPLLRNAVDTYLGFKGPIVYQEFGVQTIIPDQKRELYQGELNDPRAVSETTQGEYLNLAYSITNCLPRNQGMYWFHFYDEQVASSTWGRSGIKYSNGEAKTNFDTVQYALHAARAGTLVTAATCKNLLSDKVNK
jgi:hypothetical protein